MPELNVCKRINDIKQFLSQVLDDAAIPGIYQDIVLNWDHHTRPDLKKTNEPPTHRPMWDAHNFLWFLAAAVT